MSDRIRQMILERRPAVEIKQAAREEGMTFLRDSALEKVFAGVDHPARDQQGHVRGMSAIRVAHSPVTVSRTSRQRPPSPQLLSS